MSCVLLYGAAMSGLRLTKSHSFFTACRYYFRIKSKFFIGYFNPIPYFEHCIWTDKTTERKNIEMAENPVRI